MLVPSKTVSLPVQPPARYRHLWYANGLRFACTQCGNCCSGAPGYVWVDECDWTRIAQFLGITSEEFTRRYVRRVGHAYSLVEKPNYDCVFLTRDNGKAGCAIYSVRPGQCRTWPFWNQNLKSPDAWTQAAQRCPGMCDADAPLYDVTHIEKTRPDSP